MYTPATRLHATANRRRRGVLLLVVLSMLTLFMLLGTTYVVLASRFRSTSRAFLKIADDQNTAPYAHRNRLREAAVQVIRGTTNTHSVLRFHDLLADKYGGNATEHTLANASLVAGDQILRVGLATSTTTLGGRVVTFRTGPAGVVGTSHRIIDSDASDIYILRPQRLASTADLIGTTVLINNADFRGEGIDASDSHRPNWAGVNQLPVGTPHEPHDAIDSQNYALGPAVVAGTNGERLSYVRPAAPNYVVDQLDLAYDGDRVAAEQRLEAMLNNPANPGGNLNRRAYASVSLSTAERQALSAIRRSTLRPFPYDHWPDEQSLVDFAGKPISVTSLLSPAADVDNDGDGVAESVWLDVGLPPFSLFDRTKVKPLMAIHCIDLDGRLNVNVHGSAAHLFNIESLSDGAIAHQPAGDGIPLAAADVLPLPPSRGLAGLLRAGAGFGAADVRLDSVVANSQFAAILLGSNAVTGISSGVRRDVGRIVGRYGDQVGSVQNLPRPGKPNVRDRRPGTDPTIWPDRAIPGSYSGRSDLWSRYAIAIDHRGQPVYMDRTQGLAVSDDLDSPYEFDPTRSPDTNPYVRAGNQAGADIDQRFTPAELEGLLRMFDADNSAVLPPRLIAATLAAGRDNRHLLTTESWDTPAIVANDPGPTSSDPDVAQGLKMDLNRSFGDGRDNDSDGLYDEPDESSDPFAALFEPSNSLGGWWLTRGRQVPGNQPGPSVAGLRARQLFAWDMYRMFLFVRPSSDFPTDDRSLAQWAINVVDFLDADAIMTPFRFTTNSDDTSDQNVVWGCEQPDLVISETLAFHDRGIAPTTFDDRPQDQTGPDPDFDQIRVPIGSVFVELHNVRGAASHRLPRELYDADGNLELGRVPNNAIGAPPVWRLSFTKLRNSEIEAGIANYDPFRRNFTAAPNVETFAPRGGSYGEGIGRDPAIIVDRYVWFTPNGPTNNPGALPPTLPTHAYNMPYPDDAPHRHNTFALRGGAASMRAGDFLVVGPRARTVLGSRSNQFCSPASQSIALGPNVNVFDCSGQAQPTIANPDTNTRFGESLPPPDARPETKSCWCATPPPANWTRYTNYEVGLNISGRLGSNYYKEPRAMEVLDLTTGYLTYGDPAQQDQGRKFLHDPEDSAAGSPLADALNDSNPLGSFLAQGTYLNAATVFLERLADPTRPHDPRAEIRASASATATSNPDWNPYIVVDFMPIDLTVFNGETSQAQTNDPDIPNHPDLPDRPYYFCTRQRGFDADFLNEPDPADRFMLRDVLFPERDSTRRHARLTPHPWRPASPWLSGANPSLRPPIPERTIAERIVQPTASSDAHFKYELSRFPDSTGPLGLNDRVPTHTLGWVNQAYGRRVGSDAPMPYAGASARPLPWITWNDRPFTSEYELVLVPRTSAARLLTDYRSLDARSADQNNLLDASQQDPFGARTPGSHLIPFTSITDYKDGDPVRHRRAEAFGRIMNWVHVRSRFSGTQQVLAAGWNPGASDRNRKFYPPFNIIPTYREPGRVNINTIPRTNEAAPVWNGLLGIPPRPAGMASDSPLWIRPEPIWFGNNDVAARVDRSPLHDGRATALLLTNGTAFAHDVFRREIRNTHADATSSHPGFDTDTAWFRFEPLIRAAANTTGRSEVYAIWVTMGLFEVESEGSVLTVEDSPHTGDNVARYPDKYRLKREYGSDTGQVTRHRAFFIYDRSRPVGYEQGADGNVADGILVESYMD